MSTPVSDSIPPGWYPDPSGQRQWRVWTGERWSEMTRIYGTQPTPAVPVATTPASNLALAQTIRRVWALGVIGVIGGVSLLASSLAHLPHTAHPAPEWFVASAVSLAVGLIALGSVVSAFGVKELEGKWTTLAYIPVINFFIASALAAQRLGRNQLMRVFFELVMMVLFAFTLRADPWIAAGPVLVAYIESTWFAALVDQLVGLPSPTSTAS